MSLINQMLKDLEERGASSADAEISTPNNLTAAITADSNPFIAINSNLPLIKMSWLMILLAGAAYLLTQNIQTPSRSAVFNQKAIGLTPKPVTYTTAKSTETIAVVETPALEVAAITDISPLFETELKFNVADMQNKSSKTKPIQTKPIQTNNTQEKVEKAQKKEILANLEPSAQNKKQEVIETLISPEIAEKIPALTHVEKPSSKSNLENIASGKQIRPDQKSANLYRQALTYLQQGRVSEAQANLASALEANPINHEARQTLAGLLLDNKRNDEARATLAVGVTIAPEQSDFRVALARLQVEADDVKSALNTLEQGVSYAKNNANYQIFLATLLQRANRHEDAIEHYNAALSLNSASTNTTAIALVGLGISLQAVDKLVESQEVFTRA